ncbi:MAG: hypothetical protein ACU85E_06280 [Gammaproteobacteria bacterium]
MYNPKTTTTGKPNSNAIYILLAFLTVTVWAGPTLAANTKACEHANPNSNVACDVFSEPVAETANVSEPALLPLIGAGFMVWFGLTHRKHR